MPNSSDVTLAADVSNRGVTLLEALLNREVSESEESTLPSWVLTGGDVKHLSYLTNKSSALNNEKLALSSSLINRRNRTSRCLFFDREGFALVRSFASRAEVNAMKAEIDALVEQQWQPGNGQEAVSSFRADDKQSDAQGRDDYFLSSADEVHFFAEARAIDVNGQLTPEFNNKKKISALNKIGHGLHFLPGPFKDYSTSSKVGDLVRELGWIHPVVPQSMYIFKHAMIGTSVNSHQDSSFLFTTPRQTCIGIWLALDDANIKNGCLWVRPGSHREGLRRRFVRNPRRFQDGDKTEPHCVFEELPQLESESESDIELQGDDSTSRVKSTIDRGGDALPATRRSGAGTRGAADVTWEGGLPCNSWPPPCDGLFNIGFVPLECTAGDVVAISGTIDHLSLPNYSNSERHTFQLHIVEGSRGGVAWDERNWLQYTKGKTFVAL